MKKPFEDWSRDEVMALVAKAIISLVVGFLLGVMSAPKCAQFLEFLSEEDCIDPEMLRTRGTVFDSGVWEQVQAYQARCRANRKNGKKGGLHAI